jgi:DNA mismatch endonuclease (patch repair protein)
MMERDLANVPPASSEAVRRRMRSQRKRDTTPELLLRSALHAAGKRYRVHYPIPGSPRRSIDIAFLRRRLAVFVDGCFWHGCPVHGHQARVNQDWWARKISRNRERDCETNQMLVDAGWTVLRIWEHEDLDTALSMVDDALTKTR